MSQPTPTPDQTRAAADPRGLARREAAVARAGRRLRMVIDLGDMAMSLARAVHARALAEDVAAKTALAVREAAGAAPEAEPPAPSETVPSQSAQSGEQTRATSRARVRSGSRAGPRAAAPAPVIDAGALFARLSDIVRQCLELEIRLDEELRRLEAALSITLEPDATLGWQIEDAPREVASHEDPAREEEESRRYVARNRVGVMVEAVIAEEAKTRQEAAQLYTALRERLDEADGDLDSLPDAVSAARLCRDLGLHPSPARWPHPPPDP